MNIHWFPGHMTKSLRMMDENVALMDMLIYILDARAPLCVRKSGFFQIHGKIAGYLRFK